MRARRRLFDSAGSSDPKTAVLGPRSIGALQDATRSDPVLNVHELIHTRGQLPQHAVILLKIEPQRGKRLVSQPRPAQMKQSGRRKATVEMIS